MILASVLQSIKRPVVRPIIGNAITKVQRYFRRNEGSTDYATIPEVTLAGDFVIEFDFFATSKPNSIFMGDSHALSYYFNITTSDFEVWISGSKYEFVHGLGVSVFGKLRHIKYELVGDLLTVYLDDSLLSSQVVVPFTGSNSFRLYSSNSVADSNLSGILANLEIYDNGTLVRDYPLNDNSSTIRDLANGQDGTIINGNADDWGLFDKQADGDWLGEELVVQPINLITDWVGVGGGLIQTASTWNTSATGGIRIASPSWVGGVSVRINAEVYANSSDISVKDSATGQGADPTIATISANTQMNVEVDYVTINGGVYFRSTGETFDNQLFSLSIKEVLKNA